MERTHVRCYGILKDRPPQLPRRKSKPSRHKTCRRAIYQAAARVLRLQRRPRQHFQIARRGGVGDAHLAIAQRQQFRFHRVRPGDAQIVERNAFHLRRPHRAAGLLLNPRAQIRVAIAKRSVPGKRRLRCRHEFFALRDVVNIIHRVAPARLEIRHQQHRRRLRPTARQRPPQRIRLRRKMPAQRRVAPAHDHEIIPPRRPHRRHGQVARDLLIDPHRLRRRKRARVCQHIETRQVICEFAREFLRLPRRQHRHVINRLCPGGIVIQHHDLATRLRHAFPNARQQILRPRRGEQAEQFCFVDRPAHVICPSIPPARPAWPICRETTRACPACPDADSARSARANFSVPHPHPPP